MNLSQQKQPISNVTFNNYRRQLLIFFNWCKKRDLIKNNPIERIDCRKIRKGDVEFYSIGQCQELLEKSESNAWLHFYIAVALFTGIRKEELFRIKCRDIYLDSREIVLSASVTKTRQRRIVRIPENLVKYFEAYNPIETDENGFIFSDSAITQRLKRFGKSLSFKLIKNGFRHTTATYYLAKSQNEYETARQLGHSVEMLKLHYAGLARQSEAEAFYQL